MAEVLYVPKVLYMNGADRSPSNIWVLLEQYAEGAITLDQFISQANKKIQMMILEEQ